MAIQDYIVQRGEHLDGATDSLIEMWHGGDFVVLKGPITVEITQRHRPSPDKPFMTEPPYTVKIRSGETKRFANQEHTGSRPGDWNIEIRLLSED